MKNQNGLTLLELLIIIAICTMLLAFGARSCNQSKGSRVGTVVKFSEKGPVFSTWEGEMILGDRGSMSSQHWRFSVNDKEIVNQVQDAMDTQKLVKLSYKQKLIPRPLEGETCYFVTEVTEVKKQ